MSRTTFRSAVPRLPVSRNGPTTVARTRSTTVGASAIVLLATSNSRRRKGMSSANVNPSNAEAITAATKLTPKATRYGRT